MATQRINRPEVFTAETAIAFLAEFDSETWITDPFDLNDVHADDLTEALAVLAEATEIPVEILGEWDRFYPSDTVESLKVSYAEESDWGE